jgi:predicted transposase YdaD
MVGKRAKELISKARQEIADEVAKRELLQLIETIIVYKFPQQTRVYQEALEEGERKSKLEAVPRLLALGLSVDQVAGALDLALKQVRQAANSSSLSEGKV